MNYYSSYYNLLAAQVINMHSINNCTVLFDVGTMHFCLSDIIWDLEQISRLVKSFSLTVTKQMSKNYQKCELIKV
jgi:hypothetical protein